MTLDVENVVEQEEVVLHGGLVDGHGGPSEGGSVGRRAISGFGELLLELGQAGVVVICEDEGGHARTPCCLRFLTRSWTEATLAPALRCGGSAIFRTDRRSPTSIPRLASGRFAIGFFFAFMMLGRLA